MSKELYLYGEIDDYSVQEIMSEIDINLGTEITLRVNSGAGSVFAGYGLASKIAEYGNVNIKVDGIAMSMASYILMYAKNVEALDVSNFMVHRADGYAETDEQKTFLAKVNKDFRTKMESKISADEFKNVTGFSYDEMFATDKRMNIFLDAKQAKKLGLISKINKLSPEETKAYYNAMASFKIENKANNLNTTNKMTIEEIKEKHPEAYSQILALGIEKGKSSEIERVKAWAVFADIDPKMVKDGIDSGKVITQAESLELLVKIASKAKIEKIEGSAATTVVTATTTEKTAEEKELESFEERLNKSIKL